MTTHRTLERDIETARRILRDANAEVPPWLRGDR